MDHVPASVIPREAIGAEAMQSAIDKDSVWRCQTASGDGCAKGLFKASDGHHFTPRRVARISPADQDATRPSKRGLGRLPLLTLRHSVALEMP